MLLNPLKGRITSHYGPRPAPLPSPHKGIDIAGGGGVVRAVANGKVKAARADSYPKDKRVGVLPWVTGNGVYIGHAGFSTYSGHLDKVYVKAGDTVRAGQIIGTEGATGNVTGRHLHFEVHTTGTTTTDPWKYMQAKGVTLGVDPYSVAYVKEIQTLLNTVADAGLFVDGDLGVKSIAAVTAFQRSKGLVADGDPGPITLRALRDAALPPEDEMPTPQDLWLHPLEIPAERRREGDPTHLPAEQMIGHTNRNALDALETAKRAEAKAQAALEAISALAVAIGSDPAALAAEVAERLTVAVK